MEKYKEAPWWWYAILLALSFIAGMYIGLICLDRCNSQLRFHVGLIVVCKGQTTVPWWSYIIALLLGAFITVRLLHGTVLLKCLCLAFAAFLHPPSSSGGQWNRHESADQDGRRRN